LLAFSPFSNGSFLVRTPAAFPQEYMLYCFCRHPPVFTHWRETEVKAYVVSKAAHRRGYGTPAEVVMLQHGAEARGNL
jgi:hypothetical protein